MSLTELTPYKLVLHPVKCRKCGAKAGKPCVSLRTGKPQPTHHADRTVKVIDERESA